MEAGFQPPDENAPATKDEPILLSPDTQSDAEINERAPTANPAKPASSSSPTEPPAYQSEPWKAVPSSTSPTQSNGTPAPPLSVGGGGHISPVENKEMTAQASAPNAITAQAAPAIPNPAPAQCPQAARGPQHLKLYPPTSGTPPQPQQRPSLSQQVSTNPMASRPSVATTQPLALSTRISPANQAPRVPSHISPPHHPAPAQNNGSHWTPSDPSSSPVASQYIPFREPHTPSTLDPYTMENLFTSGGYHLPDASDSQLSPEAYVEQCNRLYAVIRTMNASVVRRVIRDTWQSSLAGSEAHVSFVLNVVTHKCSGASARVAISKFGKDFVNHAKREIMSHFTPAVLAETEDLVVEKAPDSLLDKAMAKRLNTISARSLLNMLGRAERLGYDESDIIEENTNRVSKPMVSSVQGVPNSYTLESTSQPAAQAQPQPQSQSSPQLQVVDADPLVCPLCHKRYLSEMTRDHHFKKKICQKPPTNATYLCRLCDQSFATKAGLDYHRVNKVCGGDDGAAPPAAGASPNVMASSAGSSPASFTPAQLPSQARRANPVPSASTPARPPGQSTPHTAGPPAKATPIYPPGHPQATPQPKSAPPRGSQTSPYDPYAHLSKEQLDMMDRELHDAEISYGARMEKARQTITDPALQTKKIDSLKNSFATKQSMVRKKYGVRLRERRSKAVLEQQRMRMQGSQAPKARTPPGSVDAHPSKKARAMDGQAVPTQRAVQETPTRKHAASADVAAPLSGGLAASSAAPEMVDPTKSGGAVRPPVYNGGAARAAPYPSSSQGARPQATPAKPPPNSLTKVMLQEPAIEVGDDTESDTDSDDDTIPAQLPPPPPRPSQSLSRPAK